MIKDTVGSIPLPILVELERLFPEVVPTPKDTVENIMFRSGCRYVVKMLLEKYDPREVRHGN